MQYPRLMSPAPTPQAILLLAHGTPDTLDQMAEYLGKVTGGRKLPDEVIEELQHRYGEIGLKHEPLPEGPPLTRWTLLQGKLLAEQLAGDGNALPVYVGMRNWHPYISDVVAQMRADGITDIKAICLAPQNSRTSVGLYRRVFLRKPPHSRSLGLEMQYRRRLGRPAPCSPSPSPSLKSGRSWAEACAATGTPHPYPLLRPLRPLPDHPHRHRSPPRPASSRKPVPSHPSPPKASRPTTPVSPPLTPTQ